MKYFSPETSKKLEEMGLKHTPHTFTVAEALNGATYTDVEAKVIMKTSYHTLDICELENARKLFGEAGIYSKVAHYPDSVYEANPIPKMYEVGLKDYITLSDEERVKYVEDYLKTL